MRRALLVAACFSLVAARLAAAVQAPSLVLLTLDTTRSDHLGCYGAGAAKTPVLDALAARGARYARALTASPITLPAHASLLTGKEPPEHGVRDNGAAVLPSDLPTLATILAERGYATGAFVSSRVLDRRFGLDRGFKTYDDQMAAERIGEYGYPERDAREVTSAALRWAAQLPPERPYFLWVHYYDPHAPYQPPAEFGGGDDAARYRGEIAFMDREIGRLLTGLPGDPAQRLVAAVGDHGESLREHGERGHGIFLYRYALEVPLLLAGPGVPAGRVVTEVVASRRLAPTLLLLLGDDKGARQLGTALPGVSVSGAAQREAPPVYSETLMPQTAFGWSPSRALSDDRWRLIVAPRPELYDFVSDPAESRNLIASHSREARRLKRQLEALEKSFKTRRAAAPVPDAELNAALRNLGYLSGSTGSRQAGTIDAKDGIAMLAEFEHAKQESGAGRYAEAEKLLRDLVRRSPGNVPFLTQLARAQLQSGQGEMAIATYRRAIELNPAMDFLHANLADAYRELQRPEDARREYGLALRLNPRFAAAWIWLAALAGTHEEQVLRQAVAAGVESATIFTRLAEFAIAAGNLSAAAQDLEAATRIAPTWAEAWLLWGEVVAAGGDWQRARRYFERVIVLDPAGRLGAEARQALGRQGRP